MNSATGPIQVLLSADQRYVVPLAVTLASISEFHDPGEVRATVVSNGIALRDQERIRLSAPSIEVEFQPIDELLEGEFSRFGNVEPKSFYARLLGLQHLSIREERAIYLDSDTVVLSNLSSLYEADLEPFAVGAMKDSFIPYVSSFMGLRMWRDLAMDPHTPYLNSGVMVVDLKSWRSLNLSEVIFTFSQENLHQFELHDQDGINAVLRGQFRQLPLEWNQQSALSNGRHRIFPVANINEIDAALSNPKLVHFTGVPKPWQRRCTHPAKEIWWHYLRQTDYANYKFPRRSVKSGAKKLARKLRSETALSRG